MDYLNWANIPEHILVDIYSYLSVNDRLNASLVCKYWSECFHNPKLWSKFVFKFDTNVDNEGQAVTCIEKYCNVLRDVEIYINQAQKISRDRALHVVDELSMTKRKRLEKFTFNFTGHNPLCFKGKEILDKLKKLFSTKVEDEVLLQLTYVDLNHCNVALDDHLVLTLAGQHHELKVVKIQNSCLVDNMTSSAIKKLVESCPVLEELHVFYHCVDSDVINALCAKRETSFKLLSLMCNHSDKYREPLTTEMWNKFTDANTFAEVEMHFDQSVPHYRIIPLLCPGIPLVKLCLKLYAWLTEEINHVTAVFAHSLKFLSFHTSLDQATKAPPGLEPALIQLALSCENLVELHCYCSVNSDTIQKIHTARKLVKCTLYTS